MPPLSNAERMRLDASNLLAQERSTEKVARIMASRGLTAAQAKDVVDSVFSENRWENRKTAMGKIILSALALLVFGGILVFTGRVFYIILPMAAIGFLWGGIQWLTASGLEIAVDNSSDD